MRYGKTEVWELQNEEKSDMPVSKVSRQVENLKVIKTDTAIALVRSPRAAHRTGYGHI